MSTLPSSAKVVIIGAGIVGNSVAYHLAQRGWTDMVMVDKGPLPNPGGSTGHASNFIFPVDHSRVNTHLTQDSMDQYMELDLYRQCGGIELAQTQERMEELKRRMASAKAWGEEAELLDPEGVKELFPWVNTDKILGGFYCPRVGVVDSLQTGTIFRDRAKDMGALQVFPNTEVQDIKVQNGKIQSVVTDRGEVQTEYVIVCCGVWSPRIARMAGASIPLMPVAHQMIDAGPIPQFAQAKGEIEYPILRDMSTLMYERQGGNNLEVGSYAHRTIMYEPDEIPSIDEAKLSPTEMPFTREDFEPQLEDALELLPEMLDHDSVEIQYAINGLISVTPDGGPVVGETPEVKNLWSVAAIWIKEGPGIGKLVAQWMTDGAPEIDPNELDISRFYDYARSPAFVRSRVNEGFPKTYDIVHPHEQWMSSRNIRLSPFHSRTKDLGAVFYETAGWERPHWYESNSKLLEEYADKINQRPNEWDARWWSPIINAEHLAMRDRAAMIDLSAFAIFDIVGPGALDYIQYMSVAQMDVPVGKAVYNLLLNKFGGIRSDLIMIRLDENRFRIVSGGGHGAVDKKWFMDHLPEEGTVQLCDMTSSLCTLGLWGPKARDVLQAVTEEDVSDQGFPFATARVIHINGIAALALRISYVGELGWELYAWFEQGQKVWDSVWEAGQEFGIVPAGIGVYGTTARLEKGYRLFGHELDTEYNPVEAGMSRPKVKSQDFMGKEAYLQARKEDPAAILCTLTVDDHTSQSGEKRYMLGNEPILTPDGQPILDSKGRRSYVTSAGAGPSLGKHILMAYLPPEQATKGNKLQVEYFMEHYPVTVEAVGPTPLFDPANERMKG
ncbi:MAG: FAD-dependent oxidoreductase [Desulfovermiculus sp.]|nr:FAD-dependent oxidoreductase [Desulfovermiculus sp.]